ncbi:MAG: glycosyltransferase [Ignavibacteriaceae bacterium]|nr:glycosyltransferase [Ignavibacteriaceae bacterium]
MKKKIILIGPAYPYRGGNALFVNHTYEFLKNYFDVKIYNYKLLYPSFLFPGTTQFDKSKEQVFNVPSERIVNSINPFNWLKVASLLKKQNADLVVFDWWHPFFGFCHGVISFLIRKKYKNKILFITENVVSHEANAIDKILTKIGLSSASKYLALSGIVEKEVQQFSKGKKVYRSELPVYDCYKQSEQTDQKMLKRELGFEEDALVLLFFGYVRKYKGLDILIEAFPKILSVNSKAKLLVVGEFYDEPKVYTDLISKLGIEDKVKLINQFVPNEEVGKYYQTADVVMLPYRSATQSGILNVAYGFYKPVIVTDVGGLAEFVDEGRTGFVVKPNSPDAIKDGVKKFLSSKVQTNFTVHIQERNRKNSFNQLPEVFEKILKESK